MTFSFGFAESKVVPKAAYKPKAAVVDLPAYKASAKTIKKLKRKKVYYVRIRTYKKIGGTTYYSPWSSARSVRTR